MKEHAWVVYGPDGKGVAIDSDTEHAAWLDAEAKTQVTQEYLKEHGFRCLRVRMFEVGPA